MKALIASKTAWFGIGQILFGIIGLVFGWLEGQTATTLIMTGLATIGLRTGTSQPIGGVFKK